MILSAPGLVVVGLVALGSTAAPAAARDEGMWLLTSPPRAVLSQKHGFDVTDAWLEHVRKSSVRFSTGGSGSIVSGDGLVMTNHHVGSDMIAKLSTAERNLLDTGFLAATREAELPCPDLELNVLWEIEDVTERVESAAASEPDPAAARRLREAAIAELERTSTARTGMLSEVVTLFQGARFHLYRYHRYADVRLVFAPEQDIAFFGGDTDNFEFPRFDFDICFFRIYENGAPLKPEHKLTFSPKGAAAGDLALVLGHPGRTDRLRTLDHLRFKRDVEIPARMRWLWRSEVKAQEFSGRNADYDRMAREDLFGVANSRKAYTGVLAGLLDPELMRRKAEDELRLRNAVNGDSRLRTSYGDAWDRIAEVQKARRAWFTEWYAFDRAPQSDLYRLARHLVRLATESEKPDGQRLSEYRDANRRTLELELYSPAPIHGPLEIARLESSLSYLAEQLGAEHPGVRAALAGRSPRARAAELVSGTRLADPAVRREIADGGAQAINSSSDPMIACALAIDGEARRLRERYENEVEAVERIEYAKVAAAKFKVEGESVYPDATFTLRLSFGRVEGYDDGAAKVDPFTTIDGLYERAETMSGRPGFALPQRWKDRRSAIAGDTPMNFLCAADIIGGNSGSPAVNRDGEVIGLVFDGNIHSLPGHFIYDEKLNRAISLDVRAIIAALRSVYDAGALVDEITRP